MMMQYDNYLSVTVLIIKMTITSWHTFITSTLDNGTTVSIDQSLFSSAFDLWHIFDFNRAGTVARKRVQTLLISLIFL